jgi:hypothetical protein
VGHIELGHALVTVVEPDRETVAAYNRWYEHDHFLSGVLTGPGAFAGRRFLATRALKDLRAPDPSPLARPVDDGSFIAVYWIERDRLEAHCAWGFPEAARLAAEGRMDPRRRHVSTMYQDLVATAGRPDHDVPVELALHHPYAGIVAIWVAARDPGRPLADWSADVLVPRLVAAGSPVAQVAVLRPIALPEPYPAMPGTIVGAAEPDDVLLHCCFLDRDPAAAWPALFAGLAADLETDPVARLLLLAPFIPSVAGTAAHLDALW